MVENPRVSSYAFCYRDCTGDVLYAKVGPLGFSTNIIVEAITIREIVSFGISQRYPNITIETDSLSVCKIIRKERKVL